MNVHMHCYENRTPRAKAETVEGAAWFTLLGKEGETVTTFFLLANIDYVIAEIYNLASQLEAIRGGLALSAEAAEEVTAK